MKLKALFVVGRNNIGTSVEIYDTSAYAKYTARAVLFDLLET